jgi:hypothetical protein
MQAAEVEIFAGKEKSEFAVFVDDERAFSRMEQRRFPELEDLLKICQANAS